MGRSLTWDSASDWEAASGGLLSVAEQKVGKESAKGCGLWNPGAARVGAFPGSRALNRNPFCPPQSQPSRLRCERTKLAVLLARPHGGGGAVRCEAMPDAGKSGGYHQAPLGAKKFSFPGRTLTVMSRARSSSPSRFTGSFSGVVMRRERVRKWEINWGNSA